MRILLIGPYNSVTDTVQNMLSEKEWLTKRFSFIDLHENDSKEDLNLIIACLAGVTRPPETLLAKIKGTLIDIPVLVLHYYGDEFLIHSLIESGADGYLQLGSGEEHLFEAVTTVANGNKYIGRENT